MPKQQYKVFTTNSTSHEDSNVYSCVIEFMKVLDDYASDGWTYQQHTITLDHEQDYFLVAVFSKEVD